jgi:hypothetical protein
MSQKGNEGMRNCVGIQYAYNHTRKELGTIDMGCWASITYGGRTGVTGQRRRGFNTKEKEVKTEESEGKGKKESR